MHAGIIDKNEKKNKRMEKDHPSLLYSVIQTYQNIHAF